MDLRCVALDPKQLTLSIVGILVIFYVDAGYLLVGI